MERKKRLLIVDDDWNLLILLEKAFSDRGYEVLTAMNGEEALAIAKIEDLDLVMLDVLIPGMDGYHVAHELSKILGRQSPKILMMTGRNVAREKGIALLSGAVSMVQKPFSLDELRTQVEDILEEPQPT